MQKPKRRRNYSKLLVRVILILAIIYVASTFYDQHKEMEYLSAKEEVLLEEIRLIEKDIEVLQSQIENSNTDEHIEKIAREHLKMIKKNELMFIDLGRSN